MRFFLSSKDKKLFVQLFFNNNFSWLKFQNIKIVFALYLLLSFYYSFKATHQTALVDLTSPVSTAQDSSTCLIWCSVEALKPRISRRKLRSRVFSQIETVVPFSSPQRAMVRFHFTEKYSKCFHFP